MLHLHASYSTHTPHTSPSLHDSPEFLIPMALIPHSHTACLAPHTTRFTPHTPHTPLIHLPLQPHSSYFGRVLPLQEEQMGDGPRAERHPGWGRGGGRRGRPYAAALGSPYSRLPLGASVYSGLHGPSGVCSCSLSLFVA